MGQPAGRTEASGSPTAETRPTTGAAVAWIDEHRRQVDARLDQARAGA